MSRPVTFSRGLLAMGLASALGFTGCAKSTPPEAEETAAAEGNAAAAPAKSESREVPPTVRQMMGRWLRTDGGYVLELRSPDLSGVVEAGYFNPKPIRVSRAIWMQGAGGFQVAVELNDVGYPGSTYLLSYDAKLDRLVGKYTQPAMQQSFDIEFVRQPGP